MKPDVLFCWPSGVDYPLCRLQMQEFNKYFNQVIVVAYEHGTPDFRPFLRGNFKEAVVLDSPENGVAWRETAVNIGLDYSKSDQVLFLEQDFFWKDEKFIEKVEEAMKEYDIVGIRQGTRLHPCFLRTSRALIDKTSRDFSVQGQDKDHFQKFAAEVLALGKFIDLRELGLFEGKDWYHFSSMTWNLFRIKDNNTREMHETENFLIYNAYSRTKRVPQDPRWIGFTYYTEYLLSTFGRFLND